MVIFIQNVFSIFFFFLPFSAFRCSFFGYIFFSWANCKGINVLNFFLRVSSGLWRALKTWKSCVFFRCWFGFIAMHQHLLIRGSFWLTFTTKEFFVLFFWLQMKERREKKLPTFCICLGKNESERTYLNCVNRATLTFKCTLYGVM